MSCYWDVRCLDCQSNLGIDNANHAVELMRLLVAHAKNLVAIAPLLKEAGSIGRFIDFSFEDGSAIQLAWFAQHADHRLAPVNEYGRLDTECGARVGCPTCGKDASCQLPAGHEGDHVCGKGGRS